MTESPGSAVVNPIQLLELVLPQLLQEASERGHKRGLLPESMLQPDGMLGADFKVSLDAACSGLRSNTTATLNCTHAGREVR